ncbi:MMPL family transporter [bacterium]|nr:MMPL family transporter [bacterium]
MTQQNQSTSINLRMLFFTILFVAALLTIAINRVNIDFDILNSLPSDNPIIADAKYVLAHHPFQDRVVIDVHTTTDNREVLLKAAILVEKELEQSRLFKQIGLKNNQLLIPKMIRHISNSLPYLFSASDLEQGVNPLLTKDQLRSQMIALMEQLSSIDGIGQAEQIAADPLGLRYRVLAKLAHLIPVKEAKLFKGYPISADNRHLLIVASPVSSGTNTATSRDITELVDSISEKLTKLSLSEQTPVEITSIGSYRAALDNETIVKRDTQSALLIATIGIAILLVLSFPRPYMGLLSLIPAVFGTIAAFFCCSILYSSFSILALGFGGAIISITVDHSIAYLLFLDRTNKVFVKEAANEVRSIGMIAVLTTVGAFLVLSFSGFQILAQIGQFAAMGIAFSFIFVHTIFPLIVPVMAPAKRKDLPLLQLLINKRPGFKKPVFACLAVAFFVTMLFFAKPNFEVDLNSMNTVSSSTIEAENKIIKVWGDVYSRIFLLSEAATLSDLQVNSDDLLTIIEQAKDNNQIESAFTPSMIFPGGTGAEKNLSAWNNFWTPGKISEFKKNLTTVSDELGFAADAFTPFLHSLSSPMPYDNTISNDLFEFLGISHDDKTGNWILFTTLIPSKTYDSQLLLNQLSNDRYRLFDPSLFSSSFGKILSSTFLKMLLIIGIAVTCLIFAFFLDLRLTLIALIPVVFALISTLGTLNLLNHPLDIPGLMLAIIVIGMGIDYSLFYIRSYQRYGDETHPSFGLVRTAIFLASASTIIGFGVLVLAEHSLLHSAGLVSLLGIGYSLIGANVLLPPILRRIYITPTTAGKKPVKGKTRFNRVLNRYSRVEAFPRMFARFKMKMDPMFGEIDQFLDNPAVMIDIGTGFGVPANWILDRFPQLKIYGLEPDPERVRVASRVLGQSGEIKVGKSPDLPDMEGLADTAVMLDMLHYLSDEELPIAFKNLSSKLIQGGNLVIRVTIPLREKTPWFRWIESKQIEMRGGLHHYRPLEKITEVLGECGFDNISTSPSGTGREEAWITARRF